MRDSSIERVESQGGDVTIRVSESELQEVAEGVAEERWTSTIDHSFEYGVAHFSNFFSDKESEKDEIVTAYSPAIQHQLQYGNFTAISAMNMEYKEHETFYKNDGFDVFWGESLFWKNKKSSFTVNNAYGETQIKSDDETDKPVALRTNVFFSEWNHELTPKTSYSLSFHYDISAYKSEVDKTANTRNFEYAAGLKYNISPLMNIFPEYTFSQYRVPKVGDHVSIDSHAFSFQTVRRLSPKIYISVKPTFSFSEFNNESINTVGYKFRTGISGGLGYRYSPKTTLSFVFGTGTVSDGIRTPDDAEAMTAGFTIKHVPKNRIEMKIQNTFFSSKSGKLVAEPLSPDLFFKPKTFIYQGSVEASWEIVKNVSVNAKYLYHKRFADIESGERTNQRIIFDAYYKF
ncbi:MAG: hypothetical protein KC649_03210 [Candidatus Omnitrophica bacterium]|nr:hypothetical protein [Candidatus Omnitrophota bacterium]